MAVKLKCTLCRGTFPWDIVAKGYPEECPLCLEHIGHDRADDDIVMPALNLRGNTDRADQVYRDIERGSEIRAQMAAEQLGVPVSEVSDLKITNLVSAKHPGEVAAPPLPINPVSQFMAQNPGVGGFQGANGAQYSGAVQSGPAPNAGARARTALQAHHGALSHGTAICDTPALETMQPGYRRRG